MPKDLRAAYIASVQRNAPDAYAAQSIGTLVRMENPSQKFVATFDSVGLTLLPDEDGWLLAMRTVAIGCDGAMVPVADAQSEASGNRVNVHREGLDEWFMNGPLGVEHGFIMHVTPACAGPKRIAATFEGDLAAVLDDVDGDGRGDGVRFVDENGQNKVSYTDLFVTDAQGKTVPAWLSVGAGEIAIVVDDASATYPLAIDPLVWVQQQQLVASDGAIDDNFGRSVSVSGDTALVGASYDNVGANIQQGSAYVFVRNGTTWTEQAKLVASDGATGDWFGISVSVSGETALVGAWGHNVGANGDQGSAYVFVRNGTTWTEQAKLVASDGAANDSFGVSVSLSSDTVLVGAYYDSVGLNPYQGSAYVFVRNGTTWTEQAKLVASDGAAEDNFGISVSVSGGAAVVGAWFDDVGGNADQGSAYVFARNGATWTEQAKLVASDGAADDNFGYSVSISGEAALVGAPRDDVGANFDQGSAYVFVHNGTMWTEQTKLVASDGAAGDNFGWSVSISGEMALVGAWWDDVGANFDQGSACVFARNGTMWTEQAKLVASDGAMDDLFGWSVSISGETALVGALGDDVGANGSQGSAYAFSLRRSNGDACTTAIECLSGFCVDGVCCDSACGDGDPTDCQACSISAGAMADGTCSLLTMGTECRAAIGVCDAADSCDGSSNACPADGKVAAGTQCRAAAGACDAVEQCDGAADDCPIDTSAPDGTKCPDGTCSKGVCVGQSGAGGNGGSGGAAGEGGTSNSSSGGNDPREEGGCDCRIGASSSSSSQWTIALAALAFVLGRRRSRTWSEPWL